MGSDELVIVTTPKFGENKRSHELIKESYSNSAKITPTSDQMDEDSFPYGATTNGVMVVYDE